MLSCSVSNFFLNNFWVIHVFRFQLNLINFSVCLIKFKEMKQIGKMKEIGKFCFESLVIDVFRFKVNWINFLVCLLRDDYSSLRVCYDGRNCGNCVVELDRVEQLFKEE